MRRRTGYAWSQQQGSTDLASRCSESEGASGDAPLVSEGAFGQGERGEEGYNDSGDSGLPLEEQSPEEQMGI